MEKNKTLAAARKEKGLTQEELAGLMGYSKSAVSNWENGYAQPSLLDAFKLASILNKDINSLFAGLHVQVLYTEVTQTG
ncbi:XRE family transcriptional regulator [Paenibacillus pinisoli]|uniref:XRE family transcriptional regulator n=1 Tax=Paenibacillus pinisoli TaxID=1276110 RepID=A0A3A6PGP1_9BACL|nr:helix-turn-helix transcriptional regulator [Paenibacillus pinisoli]RJX39410.1 XRE family transcriptional regulator [Paenibacillus pinisoli]